jgi:hypothetical protein
VSAVLLQAFHEYTIDWQSSHMRWFVGKSRRHLLAGVKVACVRTLPNS